MQLGHIPGFSPEQERQARVRAGLSAAQPEDHRLAYHVYAAYHAAAQHGEAALLLDEHYRCHPQIADVVNGYCYAGRLQVLTDVRRQVPPVDPSGAADPAPVLGWVDVPYGESAAGSGGRSWRNHAEADQVRQTVDELLACLPEDATVGVVTPFRAQKKALSRVWAGDDRVRVGTVHAFQGGQRDVMVLSPVATHNTPPRTTHWVASQVNLRNVAVTRAKSQLITVGSHRFRQGQSGLPAPLAGSSTVLRAGTTAERDTTPAPQTPPGFREELADLLHEYLGTRGVTDLERAAVVGATRWTCCSRWTGRTLRCSSTRAPSRAGSRPPPPARPRTWRPPDRAPLRRTRHETRAGDPDGTPAGLASTGRTGATGPTLRLTPGPDRTRGRGRARRPRTRCTMLGTSDAESP
ncbi:DEAD/DEAH box helicase [Streptomyces sp. LN699]|uniref:DEAD/DEAH box helicase n=1 Tax=Streptomyces sp. LN699 TaxID=3112981 RepID=UPI003717241C